MAVAVQAAPAQPPLGARPKVVTEVRSPRLLPLASRPWAVNACQLPAVMLTADGLSRRAASGPALTLSVAVPVLPPLVPVTVCAPAWAAVQVEPVQLPSGAMAKVVVDVTSPRLLP